METKSFKQGEIIFSEGTAGTEMYIIKEGSVLVYKTINQEKVELARIKKGSIVGEMSFFLGHQRTAAVEATENTEVMVLDENSIAAYITNNSKFALTLMRKLAGRLQNAHKLISQLQGEKTSLEVMYKHK